jgi:chromosome segregation ATPase
VTDSWERVVHTAEPAAPDRTHRDWELRERVGALQAELSESTERERIRELEFAAQRQELEIRFAYNATLEHRVLEHQHQIESVQSKLEQESERFAAERERLTDEIARAAEDLATERERVAEHQRAVDWFQRDCEAVRLELNAERQRLSYRAVQRVTSWVGRHRVLSGVLRRAARVVSG